MPQVAAELILKLSTPDALATRAIACRCTDGHSVARTSGPALYTCYAEVGLYTSV